MADPRYLGKDKNGYNIYQLPDGSTSAPTTTPPNIEQRAAYNQVNSEPKVSTGDIATSSTPATATIPVSTQNQVNQASTATDTGTDAPTVTLQQSQATSQAPSGAIPYTPPDDGSRGSAITDETGQASTLRKNEYGDLYVPLVEPPQAPDAKVVAKTSSADAGPTAQPAQPQAQPGRNKYFPNDYYMDDLEITGNFGTSTGPSSFQSLSFKVTEPNGITLLYNLTRAVQDLYKSTAVFPQHAVFVMVIKFYGWDEKGNLVTNVSPVSGTPGAVPNNSNAVVVKYLPFNIANIEFKVSGKVVEYHITANGLTNYKYAQSTALGSVPHNWQLVGETVEQVLNGTSTAVTVSGDDSIRKTTESPAQATSPTASVNDIRTSAGVNENGNFTGETASPTQVGA